MLRPMSVRKVSGSGTKGVGRGIRTEGAVRRCSARHWRHIDGFAVGIGRDSKGKGRLRAIVAYLMVENHSGSSWSNKLSV